MRRVLLKETLAGSLALLASIAVTRETRQNYDMHNVTAYMETLK